MKTPFVFGRIATDKDFTDRKKETEHLVQNFISHVNTMLISPRRWGKSSLVHKASQIALKKDKSLRFCFIDLYNIRSEEQFYQMLAQEVLKVSSGKIESMIDSAKKFLGQFIPKITFSSEPYAEFSIGLDWKEVKRHPDDILNLPEKIGIEKDIHFIICIDEFQNISGFENNLEFQKKVRSHWQRHKQTSYCLYGSKRNMLMDVFTSPSMPLYKFGDLIFLQKISTEEWEPFIKKRFKETGKIINKEQARSIICLTDCHPYYVQQLAQLSWLRTEHECTADVVENAFENLTLQLSLLFQTLTDELSNTQINFIKAVLNDEPKLSSKEVILRFNLGTSANVLRIKNALFKKEIIDIRSGKISFLDPVYKHWLKSYYFK